MHKETVIQFFKQSLTLMNKLILSFIFCSVITSVSAQSTNGNLEMHKSFWGVKFQQDGRELKPREVQKILSGDPEALAEIKKARTNYGVASGLAFTGGFLIGYPIGTALAGGDPEWGLAAGGAGALLLAIPFGSGFRKHAQSAITIYNGTSAHAHPYSISIMPYGTGAKLVLKL